MPPSDVSGESSTTLEAPGEGFLGLDLAFNCIGRAGTTALHRALSSDATSVLFLELRGNETKGSTERRATTSLEPRNHRSDHNGGGGGGGSGVNNNSNGVHTNSRGITESNTYDDHDDEGSNSDPVETPPLEVLLEEIGHVCAERRRDRRLRSEHLRPHHRRCSAAADRQEPGASTSSPPRRTAVAAQRQRSTPQSAVLHPGRDRRPAPGRASAAFGVGGETGDIGSTSRLHGHSNSVAKPRPLEGALPMRGYYVGPLLDSSFDLLMLREPVANPTDQSLYVNRTRDKIEKRRALREQQHRDGCAGGVGSGAVGGGDRGSGGSNSRGGGHGQRGVVENVVAAAGSSAGEKTSGVPSAAPEKYTPVQPLRAGDLGKMSPITINLEREHVMAERRRLYQIDSDFAARKIARVAGCERSNHSRSKLLTHKAKNAAFTKELLKQPPGVGGVAAKCPRGLRSHFLGLQNFEYDWGGGGRRGGGVTGT
ncbi:unnamed protein product [Ectocarpus sp. 12 AP-2014]